jgi:cytoskeletal protein RodZ
MTSSGEPARRGLAASTPNETSGERVAKQQPDKGARDRPNARARSAALRETQRKKEQRQKLLTIGGISTVVLVVVAVIVVIAVSGKSTKKNATTGRSVAPVASVKQVTSVAPADTAKADTSSVSSPPTAITGDALTFDGKPGVLYYGAEYCPYCAAERWPFVEALSRFGTWSGLDQTTSSATDVHPNTATFSFLNAKYSSPYISLQTVESEDNEGKALQQPTAAQKAIVAKYDTKGTIPFIDFGNKYAINGATYDSGALDGKSFDEIAAAVPDPNTDIGKAVLGNANVMTAAICDMTGNKPANVCTTSTITKLQTALKNQK